ncbi:MAG: tRNA (N6-threonylcarbamoyladenosine(37)-N6)-methyltransferase TrmO [Archaeoglobaceae archaeon]|nr:tRNA (N6-threonylcarbamoyladenosine(37)-N6)-methyltransferase TrmO [Archaeoglobaceae archaeon]MDW8118483.1 tRNA (N6-threonylcarbamoyladenosine(37)-N6)-methyltransferase TrmO [Archaeoglobaceae archaeon]
MLLRPIGVIRSPFKDKNSAPHQGRFSKEISEIEIFPEFEEGLRDIEKCHYLILLYWLHEANRNSLIAVPPSSRREHGVFATRSPNRPNPIGFSVVKLIERKGRFLKVKWLDAIDNTPLLDIKPYSSALDCVEDSKIEEYENKNQKFTFQERKFFS